MEFFEQFAVWDMRSICVRLLTAFLCGMLLGLRPEYKHRAAGMRTHILVCLGAALASMSGFYVYYELNLSIDPLRVAAQVISGIGFLGVGTIIVRGRSQVKGLTTAAGLWNCAAVGIALGAGFFVGGILCTLLALVTIMMLETLEKRRIKKSHRIAIYLEITEIHKVNEVVAKLHQPQYHVTNLQIKPARSEIKHNLGVEAVLTIDKTMNPQEILDRIAAMDEIAFAIESV